MRNEKNSDDNDEVIENEFLFVFNVGLLCALITGVIVRLLGIDVPLYLTLFAWMLVIYIRGLRKKAKKT